MTTLAPVDEREIGAFALPYADRARAFRRARRHSRQVRFLRRAIPGAVVVMGLIAFLASWLEPLRVLTKLPIDVGGVVISGTKITMQQPRIAGFTRDGRAYELTAHAAAQDVAKPSILELQGISGTSETSDRAVLTVTADDGVYDNNADVLTMRNNVVFKSSAGLVVNLSEAVVNVHGGGVVSDKPVTVTFSQGTLNAGRMEVVDSGDVIRFDGDVTMVLKSSSQLLPVGGSMRVP